VHNQPPQVEEMESKIEKERGEKSSKWCMQIANTKIEHFNLQQQTKPI